MKRQDTPPRAASGPRDFGQERNERLDSWKEIAGYLRRGLRTVQRWERAAGLPVRRVAPSRSAVYAFRADLDAWWRKQPVHLTGESAGDPRREQPSIPDLQPDLVLGRDHASASSQGAMRVRPFLPQSMDVNPESAASQADLAVYFWFLVAMGLLRPSEGMPAARAAAQRSIELGPSMSHAHAVLASVAALYDYDWCEAARRFEVALEGNAAPLVRFHYATWYLSPLGRHESALAESRRALVEDPLFLLGRVQAGMDLCSLGRGKEGVHELEQVLTIDPRFGPALGLLARECILSGRVDEALTLAQRAYEAVPKHPNAVGFLAGMLQRVGDHERSRELLDSFERTTSWAVPRARAEFQFAFQDIEAAVESMRGAVENRDPGLWLLLLGTSGNRIRATERWRRLAALMNLPAD